MALQSTQLCHMDPVDRASGKFTVTCNTEAGDVLATFACSSEHDARQLRNAIRDHADKLARVADYRDRVAIRAANKAAQAAGAVESTQ